MQQKHVIPTLHNKKYQIIKHSRLTLSFIVEAPITESVQNLTLMSCLSSETKYLMSKPLGKNIWLKSCQNTT